MLPIWRVSWRNITKNRRRFFFTLTALVMGLTLTTAMLVADRTVKDTFAYYEELYAGSADYWIQSRDATFQESAVKGVEEEAADVLRVLDKETRLMVGEDRDVPVRVTGVSKWETDLLKLPLIEGKRGGLVVPENAARLWKKGVGDTVRFRDLGEMEITGITGYTPWLAGPTDWDQAEGKSFRVMMDLRTLQEGLDLRGDISYIRWEQQGGTSLERYEEQLAGTPLYIQPVVIDDLRNNDVDGLYSVFTLVSILSLFISGFIVFNMISSSVMERRAEFATMKALGYSAFHVGRLVVMEMVTLSILATILALPIGVWSADAFVAMLLGIFEDTMVYTLNWKGATLMSAAIGLVFPLAAAVVPIMKAVKTPIMAGIKDTEPRIKGSGIRYGAGGVFMLSGIVDHYAGTLLFLLGLILVFPLILRGVTRLLSPILSRLLGYPGRLSAGNIRANLSRNANTAAMVSISMTIVMFLGAVLASMPAGLEREIRETFGGDVHVQFEEAVDGTSVLGDLPGIEDVLPYQEVLSVWETTDGEPREFYLKGVPAGKEEFRLFSGFKGTVEPGHILLGERAFEEWGGEIGSSVTVQTPAGQKEYRVSGTVDTSQDGGYTGFVAAEEFTDDFGWDRSRTVMVTLKEGVDPDEFRSELRGAFPINLSSITLEEDAITSAQSAFDGMNDVMLFLLLLIIGLSSVGISNTLLMNILERNSEIRTIRAMGFTDGQVRKMILGEGMLIGITGTVMGIIAGMMVIWMNDNSSMTGMPLIMPWDMMLFASVAGLVLTLIASGVASGGKGSKK